MRYSYEYTTTEDGRKKIVCVSHYAKKPVKGIAICDPSDEYDEEYGKKLAKLRCDIRVEEKRKRKLRLVCYNAVEETIEMNCRFDKVAKWYHESIQKLDKLNQELQNFNS